MKIYLVGGAVRDSLLKKTPKDRDYVVVGATPKDLLDSGKFKPVGKSFPVFIHKETGDEYALARKEQKNGKGHTGFNVDFSPEISLTEDLKRRDLTINSMAQDISSGELIDPFNGLKDLKNKTLKHTSDAFSEDPLRVFRVAKFSARFPDFSIHSKTLNLMTKLVKSPDFKFLSSDRILKELKSALKEESPSSFFQTLRSCGALSSLGICSSFIFSLEKNDNYPFLVFISKLGVYSLMQYNDFCLKFPLSNEERKISSLIAEFYPILEKPQPAEIYELFKKTNAYKDLKNLKKVISVSSSFLPVNEEKIYECLNNSSNFPKSLVKDFQGKELGFQIKKWQTKKIKETLT